MTRQRRAAAGLQAAAAMFCILATLSSGVQAQEPSRPGFTLSSDHAFTTRERPAVSLTFQRVEHLDFRVYRVEDAFRFFARLKDPHVLGSPEPVVPQERTWLERIADWKAAARDRLKDAGRRQFSLRNRMRRREHRDRQVVELRRTLRYNTFAQVPVLNRAQLVASWREMLPPVREAEARRLPLELPGPGVYVVEAVHPPLRAYTVVVVSDIGLVTKTAPQQLLVFTANRFSGEPVAGCAVRAYAGERVTAEGTTAPDGRFIAELPAAAPDHLVAVARCGREVAAADPGAWSLRAAAMQLVGYVYTDRPVYRPGHAVRIKAVLRWRANDALVPFDRPDVEMAITDPNGRVLIRSRRGVDRFGAVHSQFELPAGAALGSYGVVVSSGDQQAHGTFDVQEYRKPEYDVQVSFAEPLKRQGATATATISARYYFGQPVAGARMTWLRYRSAYYSPLRWSDGGDEGEEPGAAEGEGWYGGEMEEEGQATLDAQGRAVVTFPLPIAEESDYSRDYTYRFEARVRDASGREVTGHASMNATYGNFLLIANAGEYVLRPRRAAAFTARAIDYAGAPVSGVPVTVSLQHITRDPDDTTHARTIVEAVVRTGTDGRAIWSVTTPAAPGQYAFRVVAPSADRDVVAVDHVWIPGTEQESVAGESTRMLELVTDKRTYAPGETARVLVRGETFEGAMLVTKEADQVSFHAVVRGRSDRVFEVPITERDIGDTYLNIAFLKDDRLFRAEKRLKVPATSRALQIQIDTDQRVSRPGEPALFRLAVRDAAGAPVRAQLSVGVIDEALYGVTPDQTPDALRFFYRREYSRVGTSFSREYSFVGYSGTQQLLLAERRRPFTLADFKSERPERAPVRKDFPDAIYWASDVVTDARGEATVRVAYPDSLTTWRLTARAVTADTRVGGAIARTMTTRDLITRVIAPRFLTQGDEAMIPVITHNYLAAAANVKVTFTAEGVATAATGAGGDAAASPIDPGGDYRLAWRVTAGAPGRARLTAAADTGADRDAMEVSLPVLPYGAKREISYAASLAGDTEGTTELRVPDDSNAAARTIDVAVTPTLAGSLLGALDFLVSYPYGCTEQTVSSFLPNLLVTRTLADLRMSPPERARDLDRQVTQGLQRLYDDQHDDGGWGWWRTDENHPFMTAYALYGLLEAQAAGYKVDADRIGRAVSALTGLYVKYPRAIFDLRAYEVYVLSLASAAGVQLAHVASAEYQHPAALDALWRARREMGPYGRALLVLALQASRDARRTEGARELFAAAEQKGDLAWWKSGDRDPLLDDYADASVEATALAVRALVPTHGRDPLLEKAVRWLLLNRDTGAYWASTKQTAMVLYGLLDYMRARGEAPVESTVEIHVNGAVAGTHRFTAESWTRPAPVRISVAAQPGANQIRVVHRGGGPLYWTATARYFETPRRIDASGSRKLALVRRYSLLAPARDRKGALVYRESAFGGTAQPGDLLLVRLTAAGDRGWRYLMLEDPIPAGTEPVPDRENYRIDARGAGWYGGTRELRDDRVVFFDQELTQGRQEYVYLLKVVTPGTFNALPAQIAPMYVPGVRASTGVDTFRIADPAPAPEAPR